MKLTIVYDNTSLRPDLTPDWGFACMIEKPDSPLLLFDTGADGRILLGNIRKLGFDPAKVEDIFISHDHWDHTGGLNTMLELNPNVRIWAPPSLTLDKENIRRVEEPAELFPGFYSTGELEGIEQSLVVKTDLGLVLVVGCSHPPMRKIMQRAAEFGKLYGIIGGMHGFSDYECFKDLSLICPVHCTQHKREIKQRYPDRYIEGGAGKVIEIPG